MKKLKSLLLGLLVVAALPAQNKLPIYLDNTQPIELRIKDALSNVSEVAMDIAQKPHGLKRVGMFDIKNLGIAVHASLALVVSWRFCRCRHLKTGRQFSPVWHVNMITLILHLRLARCPPLHQRVEPACARHIKPMCSNLGCQVFQLHRTQCISSGFYRMHLKSDHLFH